MSENPSPWSPPPRPSYPGSMLQLYLPDPNYLPGRNLLIIHCECGIEHETESAIGDERIGVECPCGTAWSFPVVALPCCMSEGA